MLNKMANITRTFAQIWPELEAKLNIFYDNAEVQLLPTFHLVYSYCSIMSGDRCLLQLTNVLSDYRIKKQTVIGGVSWRRVSFRSASSPVTASRSARISSRERG